MKDDVAFAFMVKIRQAGVLLKPENAEKGRVIQQ
jgi:hypothetical protein